MNRRSFLLRTAVAPAAAAVPVFGYSRWVEPRSLHVRTERIETLALQPGAAPVRIAHLSDLHSSPSVPQALIEEAFRLALAQKPDIVCLTGDYVTDGQPFDPAWYGRALSSLAGAGVPVFACMGNHDGGESASHRPSTEPLRRLFEASGIAVLNNQLTAWTRPSDDTRVEVGGVVDLWSGQEQQCRDLVRQPVCPRLLLAHNADSKKGMERYGWHVMLSGHTHGGQICLPLVGAPWVPVQDKRFVHGLYPWRGRHIHVTSGVGAIHGIRFNCPPEVAVLELYRSARA